MKLYNTLKRQKEEFIPIEENKVKMYVCGPTVYNYFHIGNARPFLIFDTFRRYLEYRGFEVTYVQNFTDVDDKIIKKANEENVSSEEIAKRYIDEYFKDADGLGIKRANIHPTVTETMDEIIAFIKDLMDKGYAYESNGDVYFEVAKFEKYGKLSKQNLDELEEGASDRVDNESEKKSFMDFALWKNKKEGEPGWKAPWGEGRPGWHIECSVMIDKHLGKTIDIHAGGQDLSFPHHENEIAQSEARNGVAFSNYWLHNGYINIDNQKMSKSLNNFFTVREISQKYDLEIVRLFLLSAHYRKPVNFSDELIKQSEAALNRLYNTKDKLQFIIDNLKDSSEEVDYSELESFKTKFINAMDDDINTAEAIGSIFELSKYINTNINENTNINFAKKAMELYLELTSVLNIMTKEAKADELDSKVEALIEERKNAKKSKDFKRADEIRDELKEMGIAIEDTRQGTKWHRI
ncbi:MAG: cysteine--tRNA ligase [Peptostreptococcaceae bacterium]|jgi:cysteinyl-tRNA synthetase|nr:cysteine--tRNA ligase [Peptostreptococcaceae bacterium]